MNEKLDLILERLIAINTKMEELTSEVSQIKFDILKERLNNSIENDNYASFKVRNNSNGATTFKAFKTKEEYLAFLDNQSNIPNIGSSGPFNENNQSEK